MLVGVRVILLVEGNTMGQHLHPYIESGTLKVNTNMCTMDKLTKRWTFTSPKIDKPFGARFHFENFWEPMSVGVKVVLLVEGDTMGEYLHPYTEFLGSTHAWTHQRRDGLSHYQNLTSLSASGSILKIFGNRCRLV